MGSVDDISQLCRLCLVKDQVNIPIFGESSDIGQTFVKINSCLPVKVSRDDNLPKKICDGCSYKLDMLYIFRNTSVDSEKQLISWLNQAGLSTISQAAKDPLASTKPEIMVKQETFDATDSRGDGDNSDMGVDAQSYILQQQQLPYQQDFEFGEPSGSTVEMTDEPAPKRAKRAAAMKKAPIEETDDVEDDLDAAMQITKAEEEDSEDIDQPDYVETPSADDQPGPSGVGKASVEAPFCTTLIDLYAPDSPGSSVCCLSPPLSPLGIETICKPFKTSKGRPIIITPITEQVKTIGEEPVKPLSYMERLKEARKEAKRKLHQPKKYQCDRCGKILGSLYTLKLHNKNRHPKEAKWLCDSCDYKDFTSRGLRRHIMRNHKPVTRYECETCGKTFGFKGNLNQHRKTHVDDLFICPICQKSFKYKLDYTYHVKKHSPDYIKNQCVCEVCSKVYADARDLKRHLVTHFSAKKEPQVCDECGKSFMKLRHHKKRCHETEKRYVCEHCGRGFAYIDDLKPHVRKHTGEKPFICEVCGKNFAHSSGLKAHRNVHMKKPKTDKDEGKKQDKQT